MRARLDVRDNRPRRRRFRGGQGAGQSYGGGYAIVGDGSEMERQESSPSVADQFAAAISAAAVGDHWLL